MQQRHARVADAAVGHRAVSHQNPWLEGATLDATDEISVVKDTPDLYGASDIQIYRDISLPSGEDLKRGAKAALGAGAAILQQGAEAVQNVAGGALEWIATEAGQFALAQANALVSLFGGRVIIRDGCVVVTIPEVKIFPSFQKTLAESPPVGFFYPLIGGGTMIGPIPVAGMAGLLGYAQLSAEAAVGPGVVRGITFEFCPFKRRAMAMAQLYAAAAIAPRLTLFGGAFGAVGTIIPFEPPVPLVIIAQAGLRGTGTGWAIGAIQDTVQVEYRGGTLHFSNIAELMAGYLLTGDLDFFAALRIFSKIICQYVHPIKHWQTGRAWKLTIPIKASYGPGGGTGGVGPITWGPIPIGDIETAIRPLPAGWNCLTWAEIKEFLCEIGVIPKFLCEEDEEGQPAARKQLALAICKCVGEQNCGGGRMYRRCFEVDDNTCKNKGKLQKAADDKCNNTPDMKERCRRPGCYYRHTDAKCPVKESECKDGHFPSGGGKEPQADECPIPVNFRETSAADVGGGTLRFKYAWDSSTGRLADLRDCGITEKVDYPNGNPFVWPSPPWDTNPGTPNPTIAPNPPIPGPHGKAVDNHSTFGFKKPYKRASFTAKQVYRYATPCKNNGNPVAMSRIISIVRTVTQNADGTFKYRITKSGSSAEINPLP